MTPIASSYINSSLSDNVFTFQKVDKNDHVPLDSLPAWEWVSKNVIPVRNPATSPRKATHREVHFKLPSELNDFYPLLRAVLASGKHLSFSINVDEKQKGFVLRYDAVEASAVQSYLTRVFNLIKEEARFKKVLRKVIDNHQKYQREEGLLFTELSKS